MRDVVVQPLAPRDIVRSGLCIGCGGCAGRAASTEARVGFDAYGQLRPDGDGAFFEARTEAFARTCPFSPGADSEDRIAMDRFAGAPVVDPRLGWMRGAFVGHAGEGFRTRGSSGGMVSWVAAELLRTGRVDAVAHVAGSGDPSRPEPMFAYRLSRTEQEVRSGAKSRYYPVDMSGVVREIRATPGRYAIVGAPCFIKAVHLLRAQDAVLRERITHTLGLFCGHMKSARMADSHAWQLGTRPADLIGLDYRLKDETRPANWYTTGGELRSGETRSKDWWNLVDGDWGAGFFQNSACDWCDDVAAETADVAFGDAWVEPHASDGRGTNVVVTRSADIDGLIRAAVAEGRLNLAEVDADFVANTQAAGFRQRREGLAYRLTWPRRGLRPVKRVRPSRDLPFRRKLIYRMRAAISAWSHRVMWTARALNRPGLYLAWARGALSLYHGLAYSRGPLGERLDRWERRLTGRAPRGEG